MKQQRGFTLIELLVVIAVIGILAAVILASLNNSRAKARDARRIVDLQQIKTALELYYTDNGYYPPSNCGYDCNGYRYSNVSADWGVLEVALLPYISKLPIDPVNSGSNQGPWIADVYSYTYGNVGRTVYTPQYDLTAKFETDHALRCSLKLYKFRFGQSNWCSYSANMYEASME